MKKEELLLIAQIAERADDAGLLMFDRLSLMMDLECVNKDIGLRLEDFLKADKFNFAHDIVGIQQHLNRETKKLEGFFLPRFSR